MHVYEINTWVWLTGLSRTHQATITLANIPDSEFDYLTTLNVDAIWLMGVWERSPAGVEIATTHPDLQAEYAASLPDFSEEDISGSPYAVHRYEVAEFLGGQSALVAFRKRLQKADLKLILDFVPNHVANDHPWTVDAPDALIQGSVEHLANDSYTYFEVAGHIFAHGRDPYFPAWSDTVQVNAFSNTYRQKAIETLRTIAEMCDGVRCDMAMLMTNEVFSRTWPTELVGRVPATEFWEEVIPAVRDVSEGFVFIAEVYWDMEYKLQQQGFNYCYDKTLYDRLRNENAASINGHLWADINYQRGLMRFIENHDEERAIDAMGLAKSRMAAVLMATTLGGKLWHEGQFEGFEIKLPVQLGRRIAEDPNLELQGFYLSLLAETRREIYKSGEWQWRRVVQAWDDNSSNVNFIAYTWLYREQRVLVVINYSDEQSQGLISMPDLGLGGKQWQLKDMLDGNTVYERDGDRMSSDGLYIDLAPWQAHIFDMTTP